MTKEKKDIVVKYYQHQLSSIIDTSFDFKNSCAKISDRLQGF